MNVRNEYCRYKLDKETLHFSPHSEGLMNID